MGLTLTTIILFSVSLSLLIANLLRIPQSTSQATVSALVGPAIYFNILKTHKLFFEILPTWFVLPAASFLITLFISKFVYKPTKRWGIINFERLEDHLLLKFLVVCASCYVAFAIGSNNVANAAGPLASMVFNELHIDASGSQFILIMILTTLVIAPCFGIGSSIFGHRVVQTTGKEITEFGPIGATLISIVTATLLLLASVTRGIPTSLVQMNTAAIIGLGVSKVGWKEILTRTSVKKLATVWIVSPLISLCLSFLLTVVGREVGLL